jgi:hypothetical protein
MTKRGLFSPLELNLSLRKGYANLPLVFATTIFVRGLANLIAFEE